MVSKTIKIPNDLKISLKFSEQISTTSSKYKSSVHFNYSNKVYNAKSLLSILSAKFNGGEQLEIICDGEDEEELLKTIIELLER